MQVGPIKPTLKAPGTTRLKLKCDKLLSSFPFNFNLRRCSEQEGEKVLVFSQTIGALNECEAMLGAKRIKYLRIDGKTSKVRRYRLPPLSTPI